MARIGGRNRWIAWPAGLLCASVVGALLWMATPAVPGVFSYVGETVRTASLLPAPGTTGPAAPDAVTDCRDIYSDRLWMTLTWTPEVLLSQGTAAPPTEVVALTDALAPAVKLSCSWRTRAGATVSTTVADVGADATRLAEASLSGQGFRCAASGTGIRCTRTKGSVIEDQVIRDGVWVDTVLRSWAPEGYTDQIVARLWP